MTREFDTRYTASNGSRRARRGCTGGGARGGRCGGVLLLVCAARVVLVAYRATRLSLQSTVHYVRPTYRTVGHASIRLNTARQSESPIGCSTVLYAFTVYFLLLCYLVSTNYTSRPASQLPPLPLPLPLPLPSRRPRPPPRCPWLTTGFRRCRFSSVRGLSPSPRLPDPEVTPSMPPTPAAAAPCIVPAAAAAALGLKR